MKSTRSAIILATGLVLSAAIAGYFASVSVQTYRAYERTIEVKGLSEREVLADIAIWPIQFSVAGNDLNSLYQQIEQQQQSIDDYLKNKGFSSKEVSFGQPVIRDKQAQSYGNYNANELRFTANQTLTVYSDKIDQVRVAQSDLLELGKSGIVLSGGDYNNRTQFLFSALNDIKPAMIENATQKAREVAIKFAKDSNSRLGKIKRAKQGQFSISDRDSNTPHIKKVRVVASIEYYLAD